MALLDVTDILSDPDFMDTGLFCERTVQTIGNNGLAVNATRLIKFSAVVTSDQGDILQRVVQGERIAGSITIHSRFRLIDGKVGFTADVIRWQGRRFTVNSVNDYSHFGRGFVCANCEIIPLAG